LTAIKSAVLIVEDDPSHLEVIVRLLGRHDFEPEAAVTVGQALLRLEDEELPAAIILDLRLPDASGSVVLRNIRRRKLPIRVAVVTGVSDLDAITDLASFPPDAVFKKPVNQRELLDWLMGGERE
jgi:DNA-binding response OmpR family regulator